MGLNGLTQAEVAETLHCSRSTVSQKCTGRIAFSVNEINELAEIGISQQLFTNKLHGRANYTLRDLSRIAEFFDVSLDYLVGRSNEQKGNKR